MTDITPVSVFREVLVRLEAAEIPYMVVGSIGSILYGEPRLTKDMDLVLHLRPDEVSVFEQLFPLEEFYCPPSEILHDEIVQRGQFNLIHHASGLKIDIMLRKTSAHAVEEFQRRVRLPFWEQFDAYVATPEDIILKKLDYYREGRSEKHLADVRDILMQSTIDRSYLEKWAHELGCSRTGRRHAADLQVRRHCNFLCGSGG